MLKKILVLSLLMVVVAMSGCGGEQPSVTTSEPPTPLTVCATWQRLQDDCRNNRPIEYDCVHWMLSNFPSCPTANKLPV